MYIENTRAIKLIRIASQVTEEPTVMFYQFLIHGLHNILSGKFDVISLSLSTPMN